MRNEPQARGAVARSPGPLVSPMTPDRLFDANLPVIQAVIGYVAGQYRLTADERDEFAGDVQVKTPWLRPSTLWDAAEPPCRTARSPGGAPNRPG